MLYCVYPIASFSLSYYVVDRYLSWFVLGSLGGGGKEGFFVPRGIHVLGRKNPLRAKHACE